MPKPKPSLEALSKEEIAALPTLSFEGPTYLITTDEMLQEVMPSLRREKLLGFDTETRPAFKKGEHYLPSVLQLATEETAYVIQLRKLSDHRMVGELLSDESIGKIGVAVHDDLIKLNELFKFEPGGFIELRTLAKKAGIKNNGLRNLAAIFLRGRISKRSQTSNWANKTLQPAQIQYAATDAWACIRIYKEMRARNLVG